MIKHSILLDLQLSLLIHKKYYSIIRKEAKKREMSNSEFVLTLLQKAK